MHLAFALGLQDINNEWNLQEKSVFEGKRHRNIYFQNQWN